MSDPSDPYLISSEDELRSVIGAKVEAIEAKVESTIDEAAREFIASAPFLVLATADANGQIDASPKGDGPGFVRVQDERTLIIPDRPGNKLAYGHINVLQNPEVGVIFCRPATNETLRVNGTAELTADPALLASLEAFGKPAVLAIRVTVRESFFHCGKAFIRSKLWQPEQWPERNRVSFGRLYAKKSGAGDDVAQAIDAQVEDDYKNNL